MSGSTISRERRLAHIVPDAGRTLPRDAPPTPLVSRHMLGVIELERDQRRRRRAAIRDGATYEPVSRVVQPRIAAVAPALTLSAFDVDRWVDEGGSFSDEGDEAMQFVIYEDNGGRFHWRLVGDDGDKLAISADDFNTAEEARHAAADVHEHAGAAAGAGG